MSPCHCGRQAPCAGPLPHQRHPKSAVSTNRIVDMDGFLGFLVHTHEPDSGSGGVFPPPSTYCARMERRSLAARSRPRCNSVLDGDQKKFVSVLCLFSGPISMRHVTALAQGLSCHTSDAHSSQSNCIRDTKAAGPLSG